MLEGFCEYLRRQGKSENTVKAYCQGMKEYMRWHEETFGKRMKLSSNRHRWNWPNKRNGPASWYAAVKS